jgi:hypothetical protein
VIFVEAGSFADLPLPREVIEVFLPQRWRAGVGVQNAQIIPACSTASVFVVSFSKIKTAAHLSKRKEVTGTDRVI